MCQVGGRSVAGHKGALWLVDCCLLKEDRVEELHDWLRRRLTQQNRAPASKSVPGFIWKKLSSWPIRAVLYVCTQLPTDQFTELPTTFPSDFRFFVFFVEGAREVLKRKKKKKRADLSFNLEASYHQNMPGDNLAVRRRAACPPQSDL